MFISEFEIIFLEILYGNLRQLFDVFLSDFIFMFVVLVFVNEKFDFVGSLFAPSVDQLFPDGE
jgi:hypothetical protein